MPVGRREAAVKTTPYFETTRTRRDRHGIRDSWIEAVLARPSHVMEQDDGRVRFRGRIGEAGGRFLRVITLSDRETVHNAFFDRGTKP